MKLDLHQIAQWCGAELHPHGAENLSVTGYSIDSRSLQPGDLFFAIKGETHDGHDHVARAFEAGAAAAVIAGPRRGDLAPQEATFAVDDTLRALEALGRAARARFPDLPFVYISGRYGEVRGLDGLERFLTKPFSTNVLLRAIDEVRTHTKPHETKSLSLADLPRE